PNSSAVPARRIVKSDGTSWMLCLTFSSALRESPYRVIKLPTARATPSIVSKERVGRRRKFRKASSTWFTWQPPPAPPPPLQRLFRREFAFVACRGGHGSYRASRGRASCPASAADQTAGS